MAEYYIRCCGVCTLYHCTVCTLYHCTGVHELALCTYCVHCITVQVYTLYTRFIHCSVHVYAIVYINI